MLVLLRKDNLTPMLGKSAIISETFPGLDGHVRVATVKLVLDNSRDQFINWRRYLWSKMQILNFSDTIYHTGIMFKLSFHCWQDCALVEVKSAKEEGTFSFLFIDVFQSACSYLAQAVCVVICVCCFVQQSASVCNSSGLHCVAW